MALASVFNCMPVMRVLHKALRQVYSASPWNAENTMRAVYAVSHHQPCARITVIARLIHWLHRNAKWHGHRYTDNILPDQFQPQGYEPTWCDDMHLLRSQATP